MNNLVQNKHSILKKWEPVINNITNINNIYLIEKICFYCEWYSLKNPQESLIPIIKDIIDKVNNWERISVIGTFYNPLSCQAEYKLSNGEYVPITGEFNYKITFDDLIELFDEEFLKELYKKDIRNFKIGKIL